MFFNLREMHGATGRVVRRFPSSAFRAEPGDEYTLVESVSLGLDIQKDGNRYRVVGTLRTSIELACSRCLEPFRVPLDTRFDLRYLPHAENTGEGEQEVQEDDLATAFYREDQIDLAQLVREQIWLAIPMKPLCQEDCRGLCPVCGINRNVSSCRCESEWVDPRLAVLKQLLPDRDRT
jgi:uncharacterized protein